MTSWLWRVFLAGLLAILPAFPQGSQADPEWSAVRGLTQGDKVVVERYGGSSLKGRVVRTAEESLTVSADGGEHTVARQDVRKVRVPSAAKRALWGVIGVAGGAAAGGLACPSCPNEGNTAMVYKLALAGAAVGALAFLIPGYRTIYTGPKRP